MKELLKELSWMLLFYTIDKFTVELPIPNDNKINEAHNRTSCAICFHVSDPSKVLYLNDNLIFEDPWFLRCLCKYHHHLLTNLMRCNEIIYSVQQIEGGTNSSVSRNIKTGKHKIELWKKFGETYNCKNGNVQ